MSEQSEIDQREVWDSVYRVITGTLELMVKSAPTHEEARRRIDLVRLDLAVCESALPQQNEVAQDPDAGTVLAELSQVTTVEDALRTCHACGFKMLSDGWLICPRCGVRR